MDAPETVDWWAVVKKYASRSPKHSEAIDAAGGQVNDPESRSESEFLEATYTLAVQRMQMEGARNDG